MSIFTLLVEIFITGKNCRRKCVISIVARPGVANLLKAMFQNLEETNSLFLHDHNF